MSRFAHLWFLGGVCIAMAMTIAAWLAAVAAGAIWSTTWGPLVPIGNAMIVGYAVWKWRERRAHHQLAQKISHELRCPEVRQRRNHRAVGYMAAA